MIVRDEEAFLDRCLTSVKDIVDEICVLDTGSTDRTQEIARQHGARVETFEWCDDFAAARNAALQMCTGDWILVLDADEQITTELAREAFDVFMEEHAESAGTVWIDNETESGDRSQVAITRFFPSGPEWKFDGCIHEQLTRGGSTPQRANTRVRVQHDGYSPSTLAEKGKFERNERLLKAMIERTPDDPYAWYQLGRTYFVGGRFEDALETFEQALERCPDDAPFIAHLLESAAYTLRALGRSRQALDWISSVEAEFRDRADTCFLVALLAMDVGELERAESGFKHCLTMAGRVPTGGESSPSASSWAAAHNLGVLCEVIGRVEEATVHYRGALMLSPEYGPSKEGLNRIAVATASGDPPA